MTEEELRQAAVKRLRDRRGFFVHLSIYVIVNGLLVVQWWMTTGGSGGFWPMWTMFGWGIGLAFHGWAVLLRQTEPTEAKIQREMEKIRGKQEAVDQR